METPPPHKNPVTPLRRARRALWRVLSNLVPYGLGVRLFRMIWSSPALIRLFYRRRLRLVRSVLPVVSPGADPVQVVQCGLMSSAFRSWAFRIFGQWTTERIGAWITIEGKEILDAAYGQGKGVLLVNSHYGASRFVTFYLQRLGYSITSLESHGLLQALKVKGAENIKVLELGYGTQFFLKHVYKAQKALLAGDIMHIASDGYQGTSGRDYTFLGRRRPFSRGFAELSARTGSPVIFVFAHVGFDGRLRIEFRGPADPGGDELALDERVDRLIRQYIAVLEQAWREDPGNISVPHLARYRNLPHAG